MGSLTNSGRLAAFQSSIFPKGLDLIRCQIHQALGVWLANPNASFLAGQLVMLDATEQVVLSDGTKVLGFAKWNKQTVLNGVNVDEPAVLPGTTTVSLKKGNISNVKVSLAAGGAALTAGVDYDVVSLPNGTIARHAGGAIADGASVFVTYTFQLSQSDLDLDGRNFFNFTDDVSINAGKVTVITDAELLFTSQYDTSVAYTIGDALYASVAKPGYVTNSAGGNTIKVGEVMQAPTATDPFLGIRPKKGSLV